MSRLFSNPSRRFVPYSSISSALLVVLLALGVLGCDSDSGAGSLLEGGAKDSAKPFAIELEASGGDGGAETTSIKGDADGSVPGVYLATLAGGELIVYLQGSDLSTVFFTVDTTSASVPGDVAMGDILGGPGFLTYTTPTGMVYESTGGTLTVDSCPEAMGAVVTGSLDKVVVTSAAADMGVGGTMTLSGTFKVTVAAHDGSQRCFSGSEPLGSDGPPGCSVDTCDGPCCPFGPCMADCLFTCAQEQCMNPATFMECAGCEPNCMDTCNVDQACRTALGALSQCAVENQCEPGPMDESPCLGANCCSEYDAAF